MAAYQMNISRTRIVYDEYGRECLDFDPADVEKDIIDTFNPYDVTHQYLLLDFSKFEEHELDDIKTFLVHYPYLVSIETSSYMTDWSFQLKVNDMEDEFSRVTHQATIINGILSLSEDLEMKPRHCITSMFNQLSAMMGSYINMEYFRDRLAEYRQSISQQALGVYPHINDFTCIGIGIIQHALSEINIHEEKRPKNNLLKQKFPDMGKQWDRKCCGRITNLMKRKLEVKVEKKFEEIEVAYKSRLCDQWILQSEAQKLRTTITWKNNSFSNEYQNETVNNSEDPSYYQDFYDDTNEPGTSASSAWKVAFKNEVQSEKNEANLMKNKVEDPSFNLDCENENEAGPSTSSTSFSFIWRKRPIECEVQEKEKIDESEVINEEVGASHTHKAIEESKSSTSFSFVWRKRPTSQVVQNQNENNETCESNNEDQDSSYKLLCDNDNENEPSLSNLSDSSSIVEMNFEEIETKYNAEPLSSNSNCKFLSFYNDYDQDQYQVQNENQVQDESQDQYQNQNHA